MLYESGRGVARDEREAVAWYGQAAVQGHSGAQFNLAVMYASGRGVTKDERKAVEWYEEAAVQGYANAQNGLGMMYADGKGVTRDEREAFRLYEKAARQGHSGAQFNLGVMCANGRGVAKDNRKAVEWYVNAAAQGYADAQFSLALIYEGGRGEMDQRNAVAWYEKAAAQGHYEAQFNLSFIVAAEGATEAFNADAIYSRFRGAPKEDLRAYAWFSVAAAFGDDSAKKELAKLEGVLMPSRRARAQEIAEAVCASFNASAPAPAGRPNAAEPWADRPQRVEQQSSAINEPCTAFREAVNAPQPSLLKTEVPPPVPKSAPSTRSNVAIVPDAPSGHLPSLRHDLLAKDITTEQLVECVRQLRAAATATPASGPAIKPEGEASSPKASSSSQDPPARLSHAWRISFAILWLLFAAAFFNEPLPTVAGVVFVLIAITFFAFGGSFFLAAAIEWFTKQLRK